LALYNLRLIIVEMSSKKIGETKWAKRPEPSVAADKRLTHRHTLALETDVHFHEPSVNGMFRCHTSNIGLNGVFLPSKNMPITRKTDIELVFHVSNSVKSNEYSIGAKVVRIETDGAALVFCPEDEQEIQDLRRFLLRAKIANRQ
jgi:hypothetical protein